VCASAQIEQKLKQLQRYLNAEINWREYEAFFTHRLHDKSVHVSKALEQNFDAPQSPEERRIKQLIDDYRTAKANELEQETFRQKKRLADAERTLQSKQTKKALNDQRIATKKIQDNLERLTNLKRTTSEPKDATIWPFYHVPIVVNEGAGNKIVLARYHCRPEGMPVSFDRDYPGCFTARRDSLAKFWRKQFGHRHAIMVMHSFWENVALHDYERRELREGELPQNIVLHFNPQPQAPMFVPCVWSQWQQGDQPALTSFALITDDPPEEVATAGHNRCPITLKLENVNAWLTPEGKTSDELYALLDDRERPHFEQRRAA